MVHSRQRDEHQPSHGSRELAARWGHWVVCGGSSARLGRRGGQDGGVRRRGQEGPVGLAKWGDLDVGESLKDCV